MNDGIEILGKAAVALGELDSAIDKARDELENSKLVIEHTLKLMVEAYGLLKPAPTVKEILPDPAKTGADVKKSGGN